VRPIKVSQASMKSFPHALYFSEDLLLNYFPIDFKEILSTISAKSGRAFATIPPCGHATASCHRC